MSGTKRGPRRGAGYHFRRADLAFTYEHPGLVTGRCFSAKLDARGVETGRKFTPGQTFFRWWRCANRNNYSLVFKPHEPFGRGRRRPGPCDFFYTVQLLKHLEAQRVRVVNGSRAFYARNHPKRCKLRTLMESLGLPLSKGAG